MFSWVVIGYYYIFCPFFFSLCSIFVERTGLLSYRVSYNLSFADCIHGVVLHNSIVLCILYKLRLKFFGGIASYNRAWWLMSVILASWEVDIGRTYIWSQPGQEFLKKQPGHDGMHLSSQLQQEAIGRNAAYGLGITKAKRTRGLGQVAQHLPSKCKFLGSNPQY
jgi:hypothetical protein